LIEDAGERQRKQEEAKRLKELEIENQLKEMFKPKILSGSVNRSYMSQSSASRYQQPRSRSRVMNIITEDEELQPPSRNLLANYRSQEQLPPAKEQHSPLFMRTDQFEKLYLNQSKDSRDILNEKLGRVHEIRRQLRERHQKGNTQS